MPINSYLQDLVGAPPVARDSGTILEAVRAKYAEKRTAQAETTKIEAQEESVAEAVAEQPQAEDPQAEQPVAEEPKAEEPTAEPATDEQPADQEGEKAKPIAFKAIAQYDGFITGVGGAAGSPDKLDLDQEFLEKSDLVKMAFDFCSADKRTLKANHKDIIDGAKLVQSWVGAPIIADGDGVRTLKADEKLTQEMDVVGISMRDQTHWFVTVQLPEALKAKASDVVGFSWGASVQKTEV